MNIVYKNPNDYYFKYKKKKYVHISNKGYILKVTSETIETLYCLVNGKDCMVFCKIGEIAEYVGMHWNKSGLWEYL